MGLYTLWVDEAGNKRVSHGTDPVTLIPVGHPLSGRPVEASSCLSAASKVPGGVKTAPRQGSGLSGALNAWRLWWEDVSSRVVSGVDWN